MKTFWFAERFPMLEGDDLANLVKSIQENGQHEAAIVDQDGVLIDGRNRLAACTLAGIDPITVMRHFRNDAERIKFIWIKNAERRHLTSSVKSALGLEMLPALAEAAAERKREGQLSGGRGHTKTIPNELGEVSEPESAPDKHSGEAVVEAAALTGTNPEYIRCCKKLQADAPDLLKDVETGLLSVPAAMKILKERQGTPAKKAPSKAKQEAEDGDDGSPAGYSITVFLTPSVYEALTDQARAEHCSREDLVLQAVTEMLNLVNR